MKIGGRILWNVTAICEIFRINFVMGKHHLGCASYAGRNLERRHCGRRH